MPDKSWSIYNSGHAQLGFNYSQSGRTFRISTYRYRSQSATFYEFSDASVKVKVNGSDNEGGASSSNEIARSMTPGSWYAAQLKNEEFTLDYGVSVAHVTVTWDYPSGSFASGSKSYDIPVTPFFDAPAAPTGCTATRVSDVATGLAWTRHATTDAPYTSQEVYRSENGGALIDTAALSGAAAAYSAVTTANRKYTFLIQARNSAGQTNSVASNIILTKPAALASLAGAKVSGGIKLTFSKLDVPYTEAQVLLENSTDSGVTWSTVHTFAATDLSTSTTTAWTHTTAPTGGTVQYRATVKTNGGTQGVLSATATLSNLMVLNVPPLAPTNLGPSGLVDVASAVGLAWEHTPSADGAAQSSRQVQYSTDSGATQVDIVAGNSTDQTYSWTVDPDDFDPGQTVQWRVRTAGSQPGTYGAWSAWQTITLRSSLAVDVTDPSGTWAGGDIPVEWTATESWGSASQVAYRIVMTSDDDIAYDSSTVTSTALTGSIPSAVQANFTSYTITVTVTDNYGLTSLPDTTLIDTDFLAPGPVGLAWEYDDNLGQLVLTPDFDAESSSALDDTAAWMLERSFDGITWTTLSTFTGADPVSDPLVKTGADSWYRTTGYTALGVAGEQTVYTVLRADVKSRWGRLAYGDDFASQVRFGWSQTTEVDAGRASEVYDVEGVDYPVAVFGNQKSRKVSVTGKLLYLSSPQASGISSTLITASEDEMIAMQETAGVCLFRDGRGAWWTCRITGMTVTPKGPTYPGTPDEAAVSFTIERVTA